MKYFIALFILLFSITTQAQISNPTGSNERFIEVKVTDTILVNPDAITLKISIGAKESKSLWSDDEEENNEEAKLAKKRMMISKRKNKLKTS
jgi:hypothetical protein